jgi:hypothetical protein
MAAVGAGNAAWTCAETMDEPGHGAQVRRTQNLYVIARHQIIETLTHSIVQSLPRERVLAGWESPREDGMASVLVYICLRP